MTVLALQMHNLLSGSCSSVNADIVQNSGFSDMLEKRMQTGSKQESDAIERLRMQRLTLNQRISRNMMQQQAETAGQRRLAEKKMSLAQALSSDEKSSDKMPVWLSPAMQPVQPMIFHGDETALDTSSQSVGGGLLQDRLGAYFQNQCSEQAIVDANQTREAVQERAQTASGANECDASETRISSDTDSMNAQRQAELSDERPRMQTAAFQQGLEELSEKIAGARKTFDTLIGTAKNAVSSVAKDAVDRLENTQKQLNGGFHRFSDQLMSDWKEGGGEFDRLASSLTGQDGELLVDDVIQADLSADSGFHETLDAMMQSMNGIGNPFNLSSKSATAVLGVLKTAIPASFYSSEWQGMFSDRVEWIISQKVQEATITMNPSNLGLIEVAVRMEDGKANAMFFSQNSQVRDAIEASLPELERILAGSGISLGDMQVAAEAFRESKDQTLTAGQKRSEAAQIDSGDTMTTYLNTIRSMKSFDQALQLVDTFV